MEWQLRIDVKQHALDRASIVGRLTRDGITVRRFSRTIGLRTDLHELSKIDAERIYEAAWQQVIHAMDQGMIF